MSGSEGYHIDRTGNGRWSAERPRVLLLHTYEPGFLAEVYAATPKLTGLGFDRQRRHLLDTGYAVADAYSHYLSAAGWSALDLIVNADVMQARWAAEHGVSLSGNVHDRRRQVVAAQVEHYRPDILYVFEWCPLGDAFLGEMERRVPLLVGQIASPLPEKRTFAAYDVMISSWPPIVEYFRRVGQAAEYLKLAFDERALGWLRRDAPQRVETSPAVTFVGGFGPSHRHRVDWLERVLEGVNVEVLGYGIDTLPVCSAIRRHHRGVVWGRAMYEVLAASSVTLNRHARIEVRGTVSEAFANNMRLYEATGVGTCLLTERRGNLHEMFDPDVEVAAYADDRECIERIRYLMENAHRRRDIARAGQARTLREHTYALRMKELAEILARQLRQRGRSVKLTASR